MTDPTLAPPLWRVMLRAYEDCEGDDGVAVAAELRAVADRVAPEEPEPLIDDEDSVMQGRLWQAWKTRQVIRHHLLAEADRAKSSE